MSLPPTSVPSAGPPAARRPLLALVALAAVASSACGEGSASESWLQWGQNAQHTGSIDIIGQNPDRITATVEVDPFVTRIAGGSTLSVHYPVPLLRGDDAYLMVKTGVYTNRQSWDTQAPSCASTLRTVRWRRASILSVPSRTRRFSWPDH